MKRKQRYYRHCKVRRRVDLFVPTDATLEDLVYIIGGTYGDLFISTRQKITAWKLFRKYWKEVKGIGDSELQFSAKNKEEDYLDQVIYFFFNSTVDADFIRYCAKAEKQKDASEYFLDLVRP